MAARKKWYRYRLKRKHLSGFEVPIPEPQMDWEALRRAKQRCEMCLLFNELYGGCNLKFLPSVNCGYYMAEKEKVNGTQVSCIK